MKQAVLKCSCTISIALRKASHLFYHPSTKLREGIVFTRVLSLHRGPHMTIIHDALDLALQATHPAQSQTSDHQTWDCLPLLVTSGDDHWRPVQNCSFEDPFMGGMHPTGKLSCQRGTCWSY